MIPLKYNVRNLRVRWKTTLMTVLGTGLVVWSSCILFGLVEGLEHSLTISGDPLDLIVMRKGSSTETTRRIRERPRPTRCSSCRESPATRQGHPLAAKELFNIPIAERTNGTTDQHHRSRGSTGFAEAPAQFHDRRRPGLCRRQRRMHREPRDVCAFKGAQVGGMLKFGDKEIYRVVGIFSAGGSSAESEVWADLKDVEKNTGRDGSVSCVQIRAASPRITPSLSKRSTTTPVQVGGHP